MRMSDWSSDGCSSDLLQPEVPKISPFLQSCPCAMAASALSYCPSCCRIKKIQQSPIFLVQFQRSSVSIMSSCKSNNRFVGEVASYPKPLRITACRLHASSSKRSEEHTSELKSLMRNSYPVFCLKKKIINN